jgi:hypothetical protein
MDSGLICVVSPCGDVFEAVAEADDFVALVDAFDGGRRDDAVQVRAPDRRPPKFRVCLYCSCFF